MCSCHVLSIINELQVIFSRQSGWKRKYMFKYRIDPVPFTGHYKRGRLFRHIRTTQERRYNLSEEHKDYVRGKRRKLPEAWDDILISSQYNKSWKRHRSTQYKDR